MHRTIPFLTPVVTAIALLATLVGQVRPPQRPPSKQQIDALLQRLHDDDQKAARAAMQQLVDLQRVAVPHLTGYLRVDKGHGESGRVRAVRVLGRIGAPAVAAVPALLKALDGASGRLQSAIVYALGRCGPYAGKQRGRIREAMVAVVEADDTLGKLNPAVATAMSRYHQQHLEAWRTYARTRLDPGVPSSRLVAALADPNPFVREFAAELLAEPGRGDESALVALVETLGKPQPGKAELGEFVLEVFFDRRIHAQVAKAVVRMAPGDRRSLPAFRYLLERPTSADRLEGLVALRGAGDLAQQLVPTLIPMARREDVVIRREAVTVLGLIGPPARAAIPVLEQLQRGSDPQLAARAKAALASIRRQ